jgi:hypothetical protein
MRNSRARAISTHSERVVNETGEILSTLNSRTFVEEVEPKFVKVYMEDLMYLEKMPLGYGAILWQLVRLMNFETNVVNLTPQLREDITKNLGCSIHSVNQAISSFMKIGLISSTRRGTYVMNPYVFGKGSWQDVKKIRAEIEWSSEGRSIKTTIIKGESNG